MVSSGERVRISTIQSGRGFRTRLHAMGLTPGTTIKVISSSNGHPMMLQIMDSRVAIGYGMAKKIFVRKLK